MSIEQAFILSAGRGTRMGEIGKLWPKPLWNVFETNLLGIQIEYVKSLGIKDICVNTHHQHQHVESYLKKVHTNVKISYEKDLLGSGGGIHKALNENLIDRRKPLGVFNSDSYLFESKKSWEYLLSKGLKNKSCASLFMSSIENHDPYNAVVYDENGKMRSIVTDKMNLKNPHTYSGFGIVFPELLDESEGISSFFSTAADYKNKHVTCIESAEVLVDFGTVEIYKSLISKITARDNNVYKKLKELGGIEESKLTTSGYGSQENVYNFTKNEKVPNHLQFAIGSGHNLVLEVEGVGLFLD